MGNKTLTCPARQVIFGQSLISSLFNRVSGQVEVPAGQVNFRGSLLRSENNVLQPILHPEWCSDKSVRGVQIF